MDPLSGLSNLEIGISDHRKICSYTEYLVGVAADISSRQRKFKMRWLEEEALEEVVRMAWQKVVVQGLCPSAKEKLAVVHKELHSWDRKVLKGPRRRLRTTQRDLKDLMRASYTDESKMKQKRDHTIH